MSSNAPYTRGWNQSRFHVVDNIGPQWIIILIPHVGMVRFADTHPLFDICYHEYLGYAVCLEDRTHLERIPYITVEQEEYLR